MANLKRLWFWAVLLGLTGCGQSAFVTADRQFVEYRVGLDIVREFQLNDGTRCVEVGNLAITCEWHQPVVLVPRPQ